MSKLVNFKVIISMIKYLISRNFSEERCFHKTIFSTKVVKFFRNYSQFRFVLQPKRLNNSTDHTGSGA